MTDEEKQRLEIIISEFESENNVNVERTKNGCVVSGKLERKGKYVKELSDIDCNMAIVNEALVNYIAYDVSVEDTINNCNDFSKFQIVFSTSKKYLGSRHNGKNLENRVNRVFASLDKNDTTLSKYRYEDGDLSIAKFQDCPEHCFIYNKSLKGVDVPLKLDRKWYIKIAKKRLEDYGYYLSNKNSLF